MWQKAVTNLRTIKLLQCVTCCSISIKCLKLTSEKIVQRQFLCVFNLKSINICFITFIFPSLFLSFFARYRPHCVDIGGRSTRFPIISSPIISSHVHFVDCSFRRTHFVAKSFRRRSFRRIHFIANHFVDFQLCG